MARPAAFCGAQLVASAWICVTCVSAERERRAFEHLDAGDLDAARDRAGDSKPRHAYVCAVADAHDRSEPSPVGQVHREGRQLRG